MPDLTIHLVKIVNLGNTGITDVADPYVKFHLEQDNIGFFHDKDFGKMESSKKKDDPNPVFNETFVFPDIPEKMENMELKVKIMDRDSSSADDNLGSCTINLEKLSKIN